MPRVDVYTGYTPRKALEPFHDRLEREAILITHRQFGKTVGICNDAIERACMNKRKFPPPAYAWFYPTRVRAKDIAWKYIKHYVGNMPNCSFSETELRLTLPNNATITLYGADKSRGVGLTLDGVYYDEADEIPPNVVADVEPTLAAFKGFTVFAGMLKGRYNLWRRYNDAANQPQIFRLLIRASESGIFDEEELAKMRRTMGEAAYEMQLECNANASIANAIYGAEMDTLRKEGRLKDLKADPASPLYTFWDIGHADTGDDWTIWLVQFVQRDILFLDYYANSGKVPSHYANKIRDWEDKWKGRVVQNYLPHDGGRRDQVGKTTQDHLREAGLDRTKLVPRSPELWNGINRMRALLSRVYINQTTCCEPWTLGETQMPSGVDCLDYYTKKVEASTGLIKDVPVHNQFSHGADAARTMAEAEGHRMIEGESDIAALGRNNNFRITREPQRDSQGRSLYGQPRRFTVTR